MHTICASEKQNTQGNVRLTHREIQILPKEQMEMVFYVLFREITKKMNCAPAKQQPMPLMG